MAPKGDILYQKCMPVLLTSDWNQISVLDIPQKLVNFHSVILISVSKMLANNMCRGIIPNYSKNPKVLTVFSSFLFIQE